MNRFLLLLAASFLFLCTAAYADVKLKIAVVNPSSTEVLESSPVRYDLPKGVGPGQVKDAGNLSMKYDFDKEIYYLSGTVALEPAEQKVLEVTLEDVWTIPPEDIKGLEDHAALLTEKLKGTRHEAAGTSLSASIHSRLDTIAKPDVVEALSVRDRINRYYEDSVALDEAKATAGMLENLVLDTGGIVPERVAVPETLAVAVPDVPQEGTRAESGAIDLKIRVTNPSQDEKMEAPIKYALPAEVNPRHIIDSAGLEMTYDFGKECFTLYKEAVDLEPGEVREFVVKIRDLWKIDQVELDVLRDHTKNILTLLEGSEFFDQAKRSADKIQWNLEMITKIQSAKVSAAEHIAYYRDNMKLLRDVKQEVSNLEKLVSQRGVSPGVTVRWPDEKGGGEGMHRKRGYEGFDLIAKSIFKGKAPDIATTWKIIYAILVFIGVIAALFFALWYAQLKKRGK